MKTITCALRVCTDRKGQQEEYRMDGADFGTSELICPTDIIINGFHFPYPLNGTTECTRQEDFDDDRES